MASSGGEGVLVNLAGAGDDDSAEPSAGLAYDLDHLKLAKVSVGGSKVVPN